MTHINHQAYLLDIGLGSSVMYVKPLPFITNTPILCGRYQYFIKTMPDNSYVLSAKPNEHNTFRDMYHFFTTPASDEEVRQSNYIVSHYTFTRFLLCFKYHDDGRTISLKNNSLTCRSNSILTMNQEIDLNSQLPTILQQYFGIKVDALQMPN